MHNTEDKSWWIKEGVRRELVFVDEICPRIDLHATINPQKKNDPYAPDLLVDGVVAELKSKETPFFRAMDRYRIATQFAITFDVKDYRRYSSYYPDIAVYFWVEWKQLESLIGGKKYRVDPMFGVWRAPMQLIDKLIKEKSAKYHAYQRRQNDTVGNSKDSFVFDLRWFQELLLVYG